MRHFILFFMFCIIGGACERNTGTNASAMPPHLTKTHVQAFLNPNSSSPQEVLKTETAYGCVTVPAESTWQNMWVGLKFTGEICVVTVRPNNTVSVSFLGDSVIPVKSTSTQQYKTDLFVGELNNNQVLVVQYLPDGRVISVTQTVYNQNNQVVYGVVKGSFIKECILDREQARRVQQNRSCP